jgi:hypothetical protein
MAGREIDHMSNSGHPMISYRVKHRLDVAHIPCHNLDPILDISQPTTGSLGFKTHYVFTKSYQPVDNPRADKPFASCDQCGH